MPIARLIGAMRSWTGGRRRRRRPGRGRTPLLFGRLHLVEVGARRRCRCRDEEVYARQVGAARAGAASDANEGHGRDGSGVFASLESLATMRSRRERVETNGRRCPRPDDDVLVETRRPQPRGGGRLGPTPATRRRAGSSGSAPSRTSTQQREDSRTAGQQGGAGAARQRRGEKRADDEPHRAGNEHELYNHDVPDSAGREQRENMVREREGEKEREKREVSGKVRLERHNKRPKRLCTTFGTQCLQHQSPQSVSMLCALNEHASHNAVEEKSLRAG